MESIIMYNSLTNIMIETTVKFKARWEYLNFKVLTA